jgi:hypothetical protein
MTVSPCTAKLANASELQLMNLSSVFQNLIICSVIATNELFTSSLVSFNLSLLAVEVSNFVVINLK